MGGGSGRRSRQNTKEIMWKVSNKAMASCTSQVAISTKETSSTTRNKATGRCSGLMALSIKVSGRMAHKMEKDKCTSQEPK